METMLKRIRCTNCGAEFGGAAPGQTVLVCARAGCGATFLLLRGEAFASVEAQRAEKIGNHRRALLRALEDMDAEAAGEYASVILGMIPGDFQAGLAMCLRRLRLGTGDPRPLRNFLGSTPEAAADEFQGMLPMVLKYADIRELCMLKDSARVYLSGAALADARARVDERIERLEWQGDQYSDIPRDVFLCHSNLNREAVEKAYQSLCDAGWKMWVSTHNLDPNSLYYWEDIERAIRQCRVFVVISSKQAMQSGDVRKELQIAREAGLIRLELKIDDQPHTGFFKAMFDGIAWIDATADMEKALRRLDETIARLIYPEPKADAEPVPAPKPVFTQKPAPEPVFTPKPAPVPVFTPKPAPEQKSAAVPVPAPEPVPARPEPFGRVLGARNFPDAVREAHRKGAYISHGLEGAIAVRPDGTIATTRSFDRHYDVRAWKNVVAVAQGFYFVAALRSDGTVAILDRFLDRKLDASKWRDIVGISAFSTAKHLVGLRSDGTVVTVGAHDRVWGSVKDWRNIVAITTGRVHVSGLRSDGTLITIDEDRQSERASGGQSEIIGLCAGCHHPIGIRKDGTVDDTGLATSRELNRTGTVAVAEGMWHKIGLMLNGTVAAVGNDAHGRCAVKGWTDIVAIAASEWGTVGLKSDGTVAAVGDNRSGQCDVGGWRDIGLN